MSATVDRPDVSLSDRYTAEDGPVVMSGIQALVRLMLDQRRLDTARGLDTGLFVSGYQGSPLGGLDNELRRAAEHTDAGRHGVPARPQRGAGRDRGRRHAAARRARAAAATTA